MSKLAIIIPCPSRTDGNANALLTGNQGALVQDLLGRAGVAWGDVRVFTMLDTPAKGDDAVSMERHFATCGLFEADWCDPTMQDSIARLYCELTTFAPTMILCLGNEALHLLKEGNATPPTKHTASGLTYVWPNAIGNYRGSLFTSPWLYDTKCLATYHPTWLQRDSSLAPYAKVDAGRVAQELAAGPTLTLPERMVDVIDNYTEARACIEYFHEQGIAGKLLSIDTEGGLSSLTMFGIADCTDTACVIPFIDDAGLSCWTEDEETALWEVAKALLEDPRVPKVMQNYLSDAFILAWSYGITLRGLAHDVMVEAWETQPEMEKGLASVASIYTREPFWKSKHNYEHNLAQVCGLDVMLTLECHQVLQRILKGNSTVPGLTPLDHYQRNLEQLPICLYSMLHGLPFDRDAAKGELTELQRHIYETQYEINEAAGVRVTVDDVFQIATTAFAKAKPRETFEEARWQPMQFKKGKWVKRGKAVLAIADEYDDWPTFPEAPDSIEYIVWLKPLPPRTRTRPAVINTWQDLTTHCKDSCRNSVRRVRRLVDELKQYEEQIQTDPQPIQEADGQSLPKLRHSCLGELATLLDLSPNTSSTQQGGDCQTLLYETWHLPKRYQTEKGRNTAKLTTDDDALLDFYAKTQDERLKLVLRMRKLGKDRGYLDTQGDSDGFLRYGLNLVQAATGRLAAYESPTGTSSINPQTIGKQHRHLFHAPPGYLLGQCDLRGADSWTIACNCAALGDPTMLDDLRAGLKIQNILVLIYERGPGINSLDHETLRTLSKEVGENSWQYHACKRVLYGSSYLMAEHKMSQQILSDSFKKSGVPIWVEPKLCKEIQEKAMFVRYPGILAWHRKWAKQLMTGDSRFVSSVGHIRTFHGRKWDWHGGVKRLNQDTHREALSTEPQLITTYCTKIAQARLWADPTNYEADGHIRVRPLLTVHDSLITMFREQDADYAAAKLVEWFQNEVTVAGIPVVIPAAGTIGKDWSMKEARRI